MPKFDFGWGSAPDPAGGAYSAPPDPSRTPPLRANGFNLVKLYFVIFAAFKESVTLNLAHRSFKVIHFSDKRKPVYDFL